MMLNQVYALVYPFLKILTGKVKVNYNYWQIYLGQTQLTFTSKLFSIHTITDQHRYLDETTLRPMECFFIFLYMHTCMSCLISPLHISML